MKKTILTFGFVLAFLSSFIFAQNYSEKEQAMNTIKKNIDVENFLSSLHFSTKKI